MMVCKQSGIGLVFLAAFAASAVAEDASFSAQVERLRAMSATEKQSLYQQQQRFEQLSPTEQDKLRQLDAELAADPQGDQLRSVMRGYHQWLRALPSSQRIELLSLPSSQRLERIKRLLEEQQHDRFKEMFGSKLQASDQKVLLEWVRGLIARDEERIIGLLSSSDRQRLNRVQDSNQRRVMMAVMHRWRSQDVRLFDLLKPSADDVEQLGAKLSPAARGMLEVARGKERERLVQMWVRAVIDSRVRPQVTRDELQRFSKEQLTEEQRAYFESLPRDRMMMELQRVYMRHRFGSRSAPPFPRPNGPRGPGGRRPDRGGRNP